MLTSSPLKVLMNAANAPAQVMPLRIEPQGICDFRFVICDGDEDADSAGAPVSDPARGEPSFAPDRRSALRFRMRGSSSTTLSVPFAPVAAYSSGNKLRPITPNTGGNR